MKKPHIAKSRLAACLLPLGCFILVALTAMNKAPRELLQVNGWSTPEIISTSGAVSETVVSWFPDLAVDEYNQVHVVWCHTAFLPNAQSNEQVDYARKGNTGWLQPNDIVAPSADVIRTAIATDMNGQVHMLYGGSVHGKPLTLYYAQASLDQTGSAQGWSSYQQINRGVSYMGDIAVDSHGVIHVIYDDKVNYPGQGATATYADIYYSKSTDGGLTWTGPVNLANSPKTGSARPYLKIDSNDTLHVTWDEGWDRLTGSITDTLSSGYIYSKDGGESWSTPKIIRDPYNSPAQLTVGSSGKGGVMLVWRTEFDQGLYYQWSSDGGNTWSPMATIHNVFARPWSIPFDMYDMATDSNGNIHLILVGQLNKNDTVPEVLHLIWDGKQWSDPEVVFQKQNYYPEYPKIVISEGNQLHTVWFTRKGSIWDQTASRHIWYSTSKTDAPQVTPVLKPTATVPLPTSTETPVPSATPKPTVSSVGIDKTSPTRESEYLSVLVIALAPVVLLIGGIFIIRLKRSND